MRVVGIDMSLTGTGISDGVTTHVVGSPAAGQELGARHDRITRMVAAIQLTALAAGKPDLVVVEQPTFGGNSGRGAFVLERSALWWWTVAWFLDRGFPVAEMVTSSLKLYATGKGNAGKPQMLEAAVRRLPALEHGADDNRVDALWLAAAGYDHLGVPLCDMPATHRKALEKVRWP